MTKSKLMVAFVLLMSALIGVGSAAASPIRPHTPQFGEVSGWAAKRADCYSVRIYGAQTAGPVHVSLIDADSGYVYVSEVVPQGSDFVPHLDFQLGAYAAHISVQVWTGKPTFPIWLINAPNIGCGTG